MPEPRLELPPLSFAEACAFISAHYAHHLPPRGWKFGLAVSLGPTIVGVVTVGRPVARHLDDGLTLELPRCCTDGTPHVARKLYAAAWRACRALGYRQLIPYTLAREAGTSLRAAGWRTVGATKAHPEGWSSTGRPRVDCHPLGVKVRWEAPDA